ncbi:hypothetical protein Acr_00g0096580 [Actinidia rufa]|uniref:Uncharacterized protein n=1 Tax=Actinidia rufa TaxID=165716 RepID=A0A7J0DYP4_9ERIC|nr:hypothetical protein Acr_00g0096380 [Actinidia rufa]GFS45528.1 hypothetical protein Acr_00g0096580 [Actinidia rufa]
MVIPSGDSLCPAFMQGFFDSDSSAAQMGRMLSPDRSNGYLSRLALSQRYERAAIRWIEPACLV